MMIKMNVLADIGRLKCWAWYKTLTEYHFYRSNGPPGNKNGRLATGE